MRTVDRLPMKAPLERVFRAAMDVEQWPTILSHYRWVRMLGHRGDDTLVEMAAWRPFGRLKYPTWWVSEMWVDHAAAAVHYRHVRGITTGMDVVWQLEPSAQGTDVTIVHQWTGPSWPLVGRFAAAWVIGPVFIRGIASRTLAGIKQYVERGNEGTRERGNEGTRERGNEGTREREMSIPVDNGITATGNGEVFHRSIVPPVPPGTEI